MSCDRCGMPCKGSRCRICEQAERLEDRYGVPADHMEDNLQEDSDDD